MSLTVIVVRNVPDRYRGFLASVMLEISPGIYVSPSMSRGVRDRIWDVCGDWASLLPADGSVTLLWRETTAPGGLAIKTLGTPKAKLADYDGIWLAHHELTAAQLKVLDGPRDKATTLSDK